MSPTSLITAISAGLLAVWDRAVPCTLFQDLSIKNASVDERNHLFANLSPFVAS